MNKMLGNARTASRHEVEGFLAHDMHDYKRTEDHFSQALRITLPQFSDRRLRAIAHEKTEVLRHHDEIEESAMSRKQKLASPLWATVLRHAEKEARLLGIDSAYAYHKTEFYRLHGQGIAKFRDHVYRMDRIFTERLTGDSNLYHVTAPLYLACVAFHDMRRRNGNESHDRFAKEMMTKYYADYVFNLLRTMNGRHLTMRLKRA
jgi:hypothetical protein